MTGETAGVSALFEKNGTAGAAFALASCRGLGQEGPARGAYHGVPVLLLVIATAASSVHCSTLVQSSARLCCVEG